MNALPARYVYANAAPGIVKHLAVIAEAQGLASLVRELDTSEPYFELAIVADDRPGLLSYIAASLASCKIKVIGAQIYSFEVPGGQFDDEVAALRAHGLTFQTFELPGASWVDGVATSDGMKAVWFADPDGNILNLETSLEAASV